MKVEAQQFFLALSQTVTTERGHSLVCIPDRSTAEHEREKLRREFQARFIRSEIRKDKTGKRSTYTLRYFTLDTDTVKLF